MAGAAQAKQDVIRIVLADDDEGFLESLRALVEEHPSLSVEATATDGVRATELVQELDPDALVIDLHMPRLDGVAAIAQLRAEYPTLCVIALTGDESREIHQAVAEAGGRRRPAQERDGREPGRAPGRDDPVASSCSGGVRNEGSAGAAVRLRRTA